MTRRSDAIDGLRGALVVLMAVYHGCYIAVLFKLVDIGLYDGFWWWFPRAIAAGFVFMSGWGLARKKARGAGFRDFARRAGRLALPAIAVSAVSALVFGKSFVFFGVLHLLAVSSLLAWPLVGRPLVAAVAGAACLGLGLWLGGMRFGWPWLAWLGFRPAGVYPVDYLPLLPWFAWCAFGSAFHDLMDRLGRQGNPAPSGIDVRETRGAVAGRSILRPLAFLGRHSLVVYLAHLPLLYGIGWVLSMLVAR